MLFILQELYDSLAAGATVWMRLAGLGATVTRMDCRRGLGPGPGLGSGGGLERVLGRWIDWKWGLGCFWGILDGGVALGGWVRLFRAAFGG